MSIGELRRVLRDAGILGDAGGGPTPSELADVLWLAAILKPDRPARSPAAKDASLLADTEAPPGLPGPEKEIPGPRKAPRPDDAPSLPPSLKPDAPLHLALPNREPGSARPTGNMVAVAMKPQLPDPLPLARAMRPLRRRVITSRRGVLDEEATAALRAEQRMWLPALAPATEPAFDLAIVIDDSDSMALWNAKIREVRLLCEQLGGLRDVRTWYLATGRGEGSGQPTLRAAAPGSQPRDPRELADPSGRRIILVFTDGVHPRWAPSGPLRPVLARWALASPVAIVQPFPQRLWNRSILRPVAGQFWSGWPGNGPTLATADSVAVPVLELTPRAVGRWASVISGGTGAVSLAAAILPRDSGDRDSPPPPPVRHEPAQPDAEQLVRSFRATVSPAAYRLAGYLSAVPLTLPVMRLVQESTMLELGAGPAELAEVFLSGLLRRSGQSGPAADAENASYVFAAGVRDVLQGTLTKDKALAVLDMVGSYLVRGHRAGRTFPAVLESAPGGDGIVAAAERYPESFGRISGMLLERIGGPYTEAIQRQSAPEAAVREEPESHEPENERHNPIPAGTSGREPQGPIQPALSARPLSRSLALHRDEILAHVNDLAVPFHRFNVVGDDDSGKSELLQAVADGCASRGLLVLHVAAPQVSYTAYDSAQDRELADLYACAEMIGDFVTVIDTFAAAHPESQAATERAITWLRRSRSVARLHDLATRGSSTRTHQELLSVLGDETESVLRSLADDCKLAVLIDDVHRLDHTSVLDWLHALLRRIPTRCTVITRRPGSGSPRPGHAEDYRTIDLRNMTLDEIGAYLQDRHIAFTGNEARKLFGLTGGHEFAVATWCDLALDAGADGFTELIDETEAEDDPGFTILTGRVQQAVDQIPVDVLGYQLPLFALLATAEVVAPSLIAILEDDAGQNPSAREAQEIYRNLVSRRFISVVGGYVERGVYLPRAISEVARRRLLDEDPATLQDMHFYAALYQGELVNLDYELRERTPFAAWLRFENPAWARDVERWLDHVMLLDRRRFEAMKPALVKIYLDAFWWWDDYVRSAVTSILKPTLRRVADQQQDQPWVKALEGLSDHWVSSWDEAVLRADLREWRLALDAIRRLFGMFDLHLGMVPPDPELRRIYILLCQFYGKAHWYAGEADVRRAEEADRWLAAAQAASETQDGELAKDNPNGWIASWALLRRAEVWSAIDPRRSRGYLHGLDRKAIDDQDTDLRVGIATLIGDLRWQGGEYKDALDVYARALLISYTYNVRQGTVRKAPNLYTKSLYEATIKRVKQRVTELEQAHEFELLDAALGAMRKLFDVHWERVLDRPDPPAPLARFALPVPPPPKDSEISTFEEMDETYALETEYVTALMELADSKENQIYIVNEITDKPRGDGVRIYEAHESGPVIEAFYHEILQPSFPAGELIDLNELQGIADSDVG